MSQVVEIICKEYMNIPMLQRQYPCYWWPGDARSQGISSNDIDLTSYDNPNSVPEVKMAMKW